MTDKREEILVRLLEILDENKPTGVAVYRDRAELDDSELPAYVLLDGNEGTGVRSGDRRAPQLMELSPQIFYVPVPPKNELNVGIGPQMSEHRARLIKAIKTDAALANLCGNNGYVEYRGMETDMNTGAEVKGQFRMDWVLGYMLNFNKL